MTSTRKLDCSIVIPAFNEAAMISRTLQSLTSQTIERDRYEIIVVDNGSTDDTVSLAKEYADVVLVKANGNVGAVRNYGIENASSGIIVCTDADCLFESDWLEKGLELLAQKPSAIMGGGLKSSVNSTWVEDKWLLNPTGKASQQKSLMGSCIFVRKEHFYRTGGFKETITSGEDSEFSESAKSVGLDILNSPELSVIHNGGAKNVPDFIKRQVWHAENYLEKPSNILRDRVFFLTAIYNMSILACIISLIYSKPEFIALTMFLLLGIPLILSTKRIIRAKYCPNSLIELIQIYALDHVYLIGRGLGLLRGLTTRLK